MPRYSETWVALGAECPVTGPLVVFTTGPTTTASLSPSWSRPGGLRATATAEAKISKLLNVDKCILATSKNKGVTVAGKEEAEEEEAIHTVR